MALTRNVTDEELNTLLQNRVSDDLFSHISQGGSNQKYEKKRTDNSQSTQPSNNVNITSVSGATTTASAVIGNTAISSNNSSSQPHSRSQVLHMQGKTKKPSLAGMSQNSDKTTHENTPKSEPVVALNTKVESRLLCRYLNPPKSALNLSIHMSAREVLEACKGLGK